MVKTIGLFKKCILEKVLKYGVKKEKQNDKKLYYQNETKPFPL